MSNVIKEVRLSDGNGMVVHMQQYEGGYIEECHIDGRLYGMCAGRASDFEKQLTLYTKRMHMHVVL